MMLFITLFLFLSVVGILYGGMHAGHSGAWIGVGLAVVLSVVLTVVMNFILDKLSAAWGQILFSRSAPQWSLQEHLSADLNHIRRLMEERKYSMALVAANKVLFEDPTWAQALFIKSQILLRGFKNPEAARPYLKLVIKHTDNGDALQTQAKVLLKTLHRFKKAM